MRKHKTVRVLPVALVALALFFAWILGGRVGFQTLPAEDQAYRAGIRTVSVKELTEEGRLETPADVRDVTKEIGLDLRGADASGLSLAGETQALNTVLFDHRTIWPEALPASFEPADMMEKGKNPGLGIRQLHESGLTGKGVGIAIIDMGLNTEHEEYRDAIMGYECLHAVREGGAFMHGAAVTSIAAGKTCGVAPGASVYYISCAYARWTPFGYAVDLTYLADAIDRVIEINTLLPEDRKIRVLSISRGFDRKSIGGRKVFEAIKRAREENIFVITTSLDQNFGISLTGLGRAFDEDPDDPASYVPGMFWAESFYRFYDEESFDPAKRLLVPMDARTYASFSDTEGYEFCAKGGASWAVPYLAGLYALCVEKDPDLTPERFLECAVTTGTTRTIERDGSTRTLGTIVNPAALIASLYPQGE